MNKGNNWSREEHILAFNLYCRTPFGRMHQRNPDVQSLASLIGRTPGSVARKLCNFARLDPSLQQRGVRGLVNGAKGEEEVWQEFAGNPELLAFESQTLMASSCGEPIERFAGIDQSDLPSPGKEREAIVRVRVNQAFFRARVLSAYNYQCCITGLSLRPLLVASHIVPWAEDPSNRLNPRNGLCLNAIHDKAFDRGLIWVDQDLRVRYSKELAEETVWADVRQLIAFDGQPLKLPANFAPDRDLLLRHSQRHCA